MVQSGKITAQEALILLEALDGSAANILGEERKSSERPYSGQESFGGGDRSSADEKTRSKDKADDTIYTQLESAGEKIYDFVNNAFKKIKDIDLQFTQSIDIPHVFQQADAQFKRMDIDIANGPVTLAVWDQNEVRVECNAKVYRSNDREEARTYFLENTRFIVSDELFCFTTESKWMKVEATVYIPRSVYEKLSVRIFNGGFTGKELEFNALNVKTTNGKIELQKVNGEKLEMETVNGQIKISGSHVESVKGETVNGAVEIAGDYRETDVHSFNGNISCTLPHSGARKLDAKAVTGNITFSVPEGAIEGDLKSSLGNIKLDMEDVEVIHERKEIVQKQITFKKGSLDGDRLRLYADTKTGSITVRKANEPAQ